MYDKILEMINKSKQFQQTLKSVLICNIDILDIYSKYNLLRCILFAFYSKEFKTLHNYETDMNV